MSRRGIAFALWAALLAATVFTWPQARQLGTAAPAHIDATFNVWRVSWVAHQLPRAPGRLFDANIFHPLPRTLALSDPILVPALLGAPLLWAGAHPLTVTNLLVLAAFVLNALGAAWLGWRLTGSGPAAAMAGLVYAFAPFRFEHYMHLELLWACWMPLALVAMHRLLAEGGAASGAVAGLLVALQVMSCVYYGIFFTTALAVLAPLLLWKGRTAPLPAVTRGGLLGVAVAAALIAGYVQPLLRNRHAVGPRPVERARAYSGELIGYLTAPAGNWLYGGTAPQTRGEGRFFPGVTPVVCALAAAAPPLTPVRLAYGALTLASFDATLGFNGLTYPWLHRLLTPYQGLRVPARFNGIFLLGLSVMAAAGLQRLLARIPAPGWRRTAAAAVLSVTALEYAGMPMRLTPLERDPPAAQAWLRGQPRGAVAVVPMPRINWWPEHDARYQYWSVFHWQPLVNGYSGFYPVQYRSLLEAVAAFPDDRSIEALRARGVRYLVVHGSLLPPARYRRIVAALEARADCRLHGVFPDGAGEARAYVLQ